MKISGGFALSWPMSLAAGSCISTTPEWAIGVTGAMQGLASTSCRLIMR